MTATELIEKLQKLVDEHGDGVAINEHGEDILLNAKRAYNEDVDEYYWYYVLE